MSDPLVSVIIPTFNSARHLEVCLNSIYNQTYSNIEIIVVDKYSNDETVNIARNYRCKVIQVNSERTVAKNIGMRYARGEYVMFIDSDMELSRKVIEECVYKIRENVKYAGVIVPEISLGRGVMGLIRSYERRAYFNTHVETPRFFKRELCLKAGGFDPDIVFYEEATLAYKLEKMGYYVRARVKSFIIHHEEDLNMLRLLKRRVYYAKSMKMYKKRYRDYYEKQIGKNRLRLYMRKDFLFSNIGLAMASLLVKSIEFFVMSVVYLLYVLEHSQ